MYKEILKNLKEKTERFACDTNARFEGANVHIVKDRPSVCDAVVDYPSFRLSFTYHIGKVNGPKSVLTCLFFEKNAAGDMPYLMYDLLNYIDENDFSCYTFSYIPDVQAFCDCFDELSQKLLDKMDKIKELFDSPERCAALRRTKRDDIKTYFNRDVFEVADTLEPDARDGYIKRTYDIYFSHSLMMFVSRGYGVYLDGDKATALRLIGSSRSMSVYQRRFLSHLRDDTPAQTPRSAFLSQGLVAQSARALLLPMLVVFLLISALLTPAFYGLHHVFVNLFAEGALYNSALEFENAMFCVVPALVLGAGITAILKEQIVMLTGRKNRERFKKYRAILTTKTERIFTRYGLFTAAVVSVIISMLVANTGVKFFDKTMRINADFTQLRAVEYSYSSIEKVTEVSAEYGIKLTTVKFDDGMMFSFVSIGDKGSVRTKIYPILEQRGIEIEKSSLE